ncbi:hypothetical protein U1Q18_045756, partial [Sarracenia purpurea var. burkii]
GDGARLRRHRRPHSRRLHHRRRLSSISEEDGESGDEDDESSEEDAYSEECGSGKGIEVDSKATEKKVSPAEGEKKSDISDSRE